MSDPYTRAQGQLQAPPPPKESPVVKIIGGLSWWINSLTGKPQARKVQPPTAQAPSAQGAQVPPPSASNIPAAEDSVSQDIESLRKLVGKFSQGVSKSVTPAVSKGMETSSQKASSFANKVDKKFLRRILQIFFVIVFLMVAAFIGIKLFKGLPPKEGPNTAAPSTVTTPTPLTYVPFKPSIYAQDEVTLKLEQDIDVLTREISGTNIKETQLNPPALDYNVSF